MNNTTTSSSSSPLTGAIIFFSASAVLLIAAIIFKCLGLESDSPSTPGRRSSAQDRGGASMQVQVVIQRDGLDAAAVSLPIPAFSHIKRAAAAASPCAICLGDYEDGEAVRLLPVCRHVFHRSCIDRWLTIHSTCPLCRHSTLAL